MKAFKNEDGGSCRIFVLILKSLSGTYETSLGKQSE